MESLVAVLGTLMGAAIGVAGPYRTQRLSLRAQADERDLATRQEAYSAFLSAVHEMFEQIRTAQRHNRADEAGVAESRARLYAVSPVRAQITLERPRFVASADFAAAAAAVWEQMRRSDVPNGKDLSREAARQWRDYYWASRRRLIDAARRDTGREALDWQYAGVGASPR